MPPHRSLMIRRFFQDYKQLEGKAVEVDAIEPAAKAYPIIEDALERYRRTHPASRGSRSARRAPRGRA
jgi:inorganic pyrophosphatase